VSVETDIGSTVYVFNDPTCSGDPLGQATAWSSEPVLIQLSIEANTTVYLHAHAVNESQVTSPCTAAAFIYTHDDVAPTTPIIDLNGITASVINCTTANLSASGTAEEESVVGLYESGTCSDISASPIAIATTDATGYWSIDATIENLTGPITLKAKSEDSAGNLSQCSVTITPDLDGLGDLDADGICGAFDNCPDNTNPEQSDTDGDGIGDACDEAPNSVCGDAYCDWDFGEDDVNCPYDCSLTAPYTCGDGSCDYEMYEDETNCPEDCSSGGGSSSYCGDGYCDPAAGEDTASCPADC
jgi:hypothetical protein